MVRISLGGCAFPIHRHWASPLGSEMVRGASASKAGAEDSPVRAAKVGCLAGANLGESGQAEGKKPPGCKASSITIGRFYSSSLVGVLVRVYKLVTSPVDLG